MIFDGLQRKKWPVRVFVYAWEKKNRNNYVTDF